MAKAKPPGVTHTTTPTPEIERYRILRWVDDNAAANEREPFDEVLMAARRAVNQYLTPQAVLDAYAALGKPPPKASVDKRLDALEAAAAELRKDVGKLDARTSDHDVIRTEAAGIAKRCLYDVVEARVREVTKEYNDAVLRLTADFSQQADDITRLERRIAALTPKGE